MNERYLRNTLHIPTGRVRRKWLFFKQYEVEKPVWQNGVTPFSQNNQEREVSWMWTTPPFLELDGDRIDFSYFNEILPGCADDEVLVLTVQHFNQLLGQSWFHDRFEPITKTADLAKGELGTVFGVTTYIDLGGRIIKSCIVTK